MHFSKTYAQLLLSLPPELRESAIQYRQLKKIINQIVCELSALGLDPQVLTGLIETGVSKGTKEPVAIHHSPTRRTDPITVPSGDEHAERLDPKQEQGLDEACGGATALPATLGKTKCRTTPTKPKTKVIYELEADDGLGMIVPRLRIYVDAPAVEDLERHNEALRGSKPEREDDSEDGSSVADLREENISVDDADSEEGDQDPQDPQYPWLHSLQTRLNTTRDQSINYSSSKELVIPLVHDTEFYRLLLDALKIVSEHLSVVRANFVQTLKQLALTIGDSSRPASGASAKSFQPFSPVTMHAGALKLSKADLKSDLYFWREIFQLYAESEVFESMSEASRGEWDVEESERRLKLFADRAVQQGLGDGSRLKLKKSKEALETFIDLNMFILNVKKLSFANSEATRKILKKHAKRTGLTGEHANPEPLLALVGYTRASSLPRTLVQVIGEVLLPIIPHVDDYSCLICMSIAFKPIRLSCAHLFCVRCLVKMQKRGQENCPLCRTPSVLVANRTNVDWALLNFMQDWFPVESREKLITNEKEAAAEHAKELGVDIDQPCVIM